MTKFVFPIIELVDRYTIALVKYEKTGGANAPELHFYEQQMQQLNMNLIQQELHSLTEIHRKIWAMEDKFKKGQIDNAPINEIGLQALAIRDLNNHRIEYKNTIAEKMQDSVREIKKYGP
jgi:hypothetical protein